MKKLVVCQPYRSPQGTQVRLSYITDDDKHIILFETENERESVHTVHPDKDRARDMWMDTAQLLRALGFERFVK